MNSPAETKVEQLLDRAGRSMPLRRAPASLESRVLAEIERRAALPWWRRSFEQWPPLARAAFLLTCGVLAVLALTVGIWAVTNLGPWARDALTLVGIAGDFAATLAHLIPQDWIFKGLAASALLYGALFGLSVAAYRTLYKTESAGDFSP